MVPGGAREGRYRVGYGGVRGGYGYGWYGGRPWVEPGRAWEGPGRLISSK